MSKFDAAQKAEANAHVRKAVEKAIDAGTEVGMQVVAYMDGEEVINQNVGLADPETGHTVDGDSLFNVYSVSKAITVTALHVQVERGLIEYDAPVIEYWPEYGANGKEATTVRDVITHRSGVPQMPEGTTPEDMCDWDAMVAKIAAQVPIAPPGTKALYQSLTFGWLVGEIVRRSDGRKRSFGQFVRDEVGKPLGAPDLWIGVSPDVEARIARHSNATPAYEVDGLVAAAMPAQLSLVPEIYANREDVRRAEIPAVGGLFTARSCARVWAMLAQGGELDGVRLLSPELVATFNAPRNNSDEPDPCMFGQSIALGVAGYWLGGHESPVCAARHPRVICHPGAGGSMAWADFETKTAVAICHNHMFQPPSRADDPLLPIADAVWEALKIA